MFKNCQVLSSIKCLYIGLQAVKGMIQTVPTDSNHIGSPPRAPDPTLRGHGDPAPPPTLNHHRGESPLQALGPGPPPAPLNREPSE